MTLSTVAVPLSVSRGFSLIEILISLLILSLGILGTIGMQVNAIQVARQTNYYSTAVRLAAEMADQLRTSKHHPAAIQETTQWLRGTNEVLPNLRAVICRDESPWDSHTNSLRWSCSTSNSTSNSASNLTSHNNTSVIIKLGWSDLTNSDPNSPPRFALAVNP